MNAGKAIYYLLSNASSVTDICGTRIYPELAEQEAPTPFVVYEVISVDPDDTNDGPAKLDEVSVDITAVADSYDTCADLASAIRSAIDRVRGTYNGVNVDSIQYSTTDTDVFDSPRRYAMTAGFVIRISRDDAQIATGQDIDALTLDRLADVVITDPQDHEALVYDQDTDTWINGASTKIGIRVINTGFQLPKGTPVRATGVQGDQVIVAAFNASQHDPKTFVGMLSETLGTGATGYARQTGAIYGLDTSPFEIGDILYPKDTPVISLLNGMDYMTTSAPTTPGAKIACAIVLRKHENTGRVYVRTWTPSRTLGDLDDVDTASGDGNALIYNGTKWLKGLPTMNLYDIRDVQDYDPALLQDKTILRWSSTEDYWELVPQNSFLPTDDRYFLNRYDTEANTARQAADATLTIERYLSVQADGHGEELTQQSDTPSQDNKIVRKIWHKAVSFEDSDVSTWTLVHTFADDTDYADTTATFDALLTAATYGSIPFTLAQTWEDVPAFSGLLETYSGAAAAYSLRLLDSTYTGDAIRVRRASDNAEQDIGFTDNELDTSALATFCAGTDGFVKTWYDQSGNGNDATQTATGAQPKIYDASTGVVMENGKSTTYFDGTDILNISGTIIGTASDMQVAWVARRNTAAEANARGLFDTFTDRTIFDVTGSGWLFDGTYSLNPINYGDAQKLAFLDLITPTASAYINSSLHATTGWTQSAIITGELGSGGSGRMTGYLQEFIIWSADQSSNRTAIETAINEHYDIYS